MTKERQALVFFTRESYLGAWSLARLLLNLEKLVKQVSCQIRRRSITSFFHAFPAINHSENESEAEGKSLVMESRAFYSSIPQ